MPLLALLWLQLVAGVLTARAAAVELRASPEHALRTRAARLLLAHEALVMLPVSAALYLRMGDWLLSYAVDAARVPSLAAALGVAVLAAAALGAYGFAAEWLRAAHERRGAVLVAIAGAGMLAGLAAARGRLGVLGSGLQFRGGFGLVRLLTAPPLTLLGALAALYALGLALHLQLVRREARRLLESEQGVQR